MLAARVGAPIDVARAGRLAQRIGGISGGRVAAADRGRSFAEPPRLATRLSGV
jgi:hypothetical protein